MHELTRYVLTPLLVLCCIAQTHGAPGDPGTLDVFFATGSPVGAGKVVTSIGGNDFATSMAVQADGKIVVVGYCHNGSNYDFCALRYHGGSDPSFPGGTLDQSFNGTGKVLTPIGSLNDLALAVAVQPDGKIVLAGGCFIGGGGNANVCALRYLAHGVLDPDFNGTGTAITPISGHNVAYAIALQPDGKILLAGVASSPITNDDFIALRYLGDGTLDASFNGTGTVTTSFSSGANADAARAVVLQPDGKIVLGGACNNGTGAFTFCALRYHGGSDPNFAAGALDQNFNGTGKVLTPIGIAAEANAIALQPDGKIVLSGVCRIGTPYEVCAVRYNADGTLDSSFGVAARLVVPINTDGQRFAAAVAVQPDGKIVIAARSYNGTNSDLHTIRVLGNGSFDSSFSGTGTVVTAVGIGDDSASAVSIQPDGKIVLAGTCSNGATNDFCAVRYNGGPFAFNNCSLDIDGDNLVLPMTDALIHTRIALGFTGSAVVNGINFPVAATRTTWPTIRTYLVTQCGMTLAQ